MTKAICFDLLTGLLDSWTLWNAVAGNPEIGVAWRAAYLKHTYQTKAYRPYETLVAEAAVLVGLSADCAQRLAERYEELRPWPEAADVLRALRGKGLSLAVVTNCSERLGSIAARCVGVPFDVVVTAERAGFYKPHPRPYYTALEELGVTPAESFFVAGSAYDLAGTTKIGIPAYWHNRARLPLPPDIVEPLGQGPNLLGLPFFLTETCAR